MTHINPKNFATWIESIASMAGFQAIQVGEYLVAIDCQIKNGRKQTVWIKPLGDDPMENSVIQISSPAQKIGAGFLISQQEANSLLRENISLFHGAWGIENIEGDDYIVVFDTHIAQTLDTKELASSIQSIAHLADRMEESLGDQDKF